ncbi:MAG: hypothetical protein OEU93_01235 [Rubrivivax sp.]|nr:hypothetical protein [Rubrivivax sp.]
MDSNKLMDALGSFQQELPSEINILELRRSSVDDQQRRLRKLLKVSGDACERDFDRGQWQTFDDHTLVRLPQGAHAVLFHASGAVKLTSGLGEMESLFKEPEPKKQLVDRAEALLKTLGLHEQLGRREMLTFERLWQIKACAADRSGKTIEPVLCRAVGAFRHHVEGIPVLGPASVAVQLAGSGELDMISILMRSPEGETLERVKALHPERGARGIVQQLAEQFADSRGEIQFDCRDGMRFGYLSLPKRKTQRLLAPVYMATIDVTHDKERQGLVLAVRATEKSYLPLNPPGHESPPSISSKTAGQRCC